MPSIRPVLVLALALVTDPSSAAPSATPAAPKSPPRSPVTRVEVVRDTLHGVVVEDAYRWLEDKGSPETRKWIGAQQVYTRAVLGTLPGRAALRARIGQYLRVDGVTSPKEAGGRYFFTKRLASQDIPVLVMREGRKGADQVLVDPDTMSKDHTVNVELLDVSRDGKLVAYGIRRGGEDEIEIALLDVDAHRTLADRLPRARYFGVSIRPDQSGFFYTRYNEQGSRICQHTMGADPTKDRVLFGEQYGPEKIVASALSEDGRWLLIVVYYGSAGKKNDVYVKDVSIDGPIVTVVDDVDATFAPDIGDDRLYLRTNWQAQNQRILVAELAHPDRPNWREVVPAGPDAMEDFALAGGKIFVSYLHNVASNLKVYDADGRNEREVALPTLGAVTSVGGRWSSTDAFFTFQSFHVTRTIYRYDVAAGRADPWWRASPPIQSDRYQLDQVWYASKDGTRVPMFVLHRKGLVLDGSHPTMLTGYGGFRVNEVPEFHSWIAMWVEMGGVVASPSLRGGAEFGEAWHEAGMLEKKQNVFDDFIGAAEWLIANHYTTPDKLGIEGGSNGGLLVGAFLTQRPDLCRAVLCEVPLLDMLRYHKFLVARFWVPEYGSSDDAEQFTFLRAYSPYQRVTPGTKYPAILFVTGDSDTRVDPLHARKMTALMQTLATPERPSLLLYDTKIGHSGAKPIPKQIEDLTDELSFLGWQLGLAPPSGPTPSRASTAAP